MHHLYLFRFYILLPVSPEDVIFHITVYYLFLIPGDISMSHLPYLHHTQDSVLLRCPLLLCPQGSESQASSGASPPGREAP